MGVDRPDLLCYTLGRHILLSKIIIIGNWRAAMSEENQEFRTDDDLNNMEIIDYDIDERINEGETEQKPVIPDGAEPFREYKEPFSWKREIISWIKMILVAIVLAFVITRFIVINANVPTGSMEDTIPTGSRIMGLRLSYLFGEPERGDVIVFKYQFAELEGEENLNYVKRIIGLPGETVVIKGGKIDIYKGDEHIGTLDESSYLKETKWSGDYTFEVPEGRYMVMGDNRNHSADIREWYAKIYQNGYCKYEDLFVDKDAILGKVYFTYWPSFGFVNH